MTSSSKTGSEQTGHSEQSGNFPASILDGDTDFLIAGGVLPDTLSRLAIFEDE